MEMLTMLIRIEEGNHDNHWIVRLDDYPVTCRNWHEAKAFADRMQSRIDAPHPLPQRTARRPAADRSHAAAS
jgi:formylglycine-generating enzyme required for sulfatase activity